ncbi:MAG: hypothetical protein V4850_02525 [Myxococcota bacterium]
MIALVAAAMAAPVDVAVGWGVGVDARLGKGAVFVGAGAGPTVRVGVGEHLDLHAEGRWLTLAGSTWLVRGGAGLHTTVGTWQPGVGLDVTGYLGATLRAVTAENPGLAGDSALAVQVRLEPLRFAKDRWSANVLRLDVGAGWDRARPALAVGVTVVEVGIGF